MVGDIEIKGIIDYNFNMEKKVRKAHLKDGDELDIQYWKSKSPEEKLDILQYLRDVYFEFKNESRKGFQRVYRVIKQK